MIASLASPAGIQLPPELYLNIIQLLLSQDLRKTVAALQRCSKAHYTFVSPYLYELFTLNAEAVRGMIALLRDSMDPLQERMLNINLEEPIGFDDSEAVRYLKLLSNVKRLFVPISRVLLLHDEEIMKSLCRRAGLSSVVSLPLFQHVDYLSLHDEGDVPYRYGLRMRKDAIEELIDFIVQHCNPKHLCLNLDIKGPMDGSHRQIPKLYSSMTRLEEIDIHRFCHYVHMPPLGSRMNTTEARESCGGYQDDIFFALSDGLKVVKVDPRDQAVREAIKPIKMIAKNKEHLTEDDINRFHEQLLYHALEERGQRRSWTNTENIDPNQEALARKDVEERKKYVEWVVREDCKSEENCRVCSSHVTDSTCLVPI
ncbi:uncharacterized protein L199_001096 [Kwoniella botswanensis]|uniref:uncharacterized protein n=1 Tax=Kwoniella botswanensis TaxID=1268659 RepID=UPI00315D801E